jgi:hypothetical protein
MKARERDKKACIQVRRMKHTLFLSPLENICCSIRYETKQHAITCYDMLIDMQ